MDNTPIENPDKQAEESAGKSAFNLIAFCIDRWKNIVSIIGMIIVLVFVYGLVTSSWDCGKIHKGTAPLPTKRSN